MDRKCHNTLIMLRNRYDSNSLQNFRAHYIDAISLDRLCLKEWRAQRRMHNA